MRTESWKLVVALALISAAVYLYVSSRPAPPPAAPVARGPISRPSRPRVASAGAPRIGPGVPRVATSPTAAPVIKPEARPTPPAAAPRASSEAPRPSLRYRVDDGIAVVLGDVAVGVLTDPAAPTSGTVSLAPLKTWSPDTPIAYFIQPGVANPARVRQALTLFARTRVRFVELTDQTDALVFEPTNGICKSYLGRIGGHQPIWVAPDCGPAEIAHEIMHALGFAHEQNRADRDAFITVHLDAIEDEFRYNFDKFPPSYTRRNQAAPFDFTSIMMYPPWMFAKGGQTTMTPKDPDQRIAPGTVLSPGDERRL